MIRIAITIASILFGLVGFNATVSAEGMWQEGVHYKLLPYPVKVRDPKKIEVIEVFWYGCPHCYEFNNKYLGNWEKTLPKDVDFWLLPAAFGRTWEMHAKLFYAAKFLGLEKKLHQTIFDSIQKGGRKLDNLAEIKDFLVAHGADGAAFDKLFEAQGFRKISRIDQAIDEDKERLKKYQVTGVPALIVDGKYRVGVEDAGSFANMLKITNYLIAKERESMKP
jgi:thiol:disulfide interchange protein DsbA